MMNKSPLYMAILTVLFAGILAKLRAMYNKQVPLGYEDESGFHFGPEPRH
jgi:hypothetical protein